MSREIEFRVYIKPLKRYATGYETILYHHQCNARHAWTVNISPEEYYGDEDLIVEQFTGLKDKNGKKIYEGNIVKTCCGKAKVFFDEEYCSYKIWLKHGTIMPLVGKKSHRHLGYEVIGTIHENPELLEDEE